MVKKVFIICIVILLCGCALALKEKPVVHNDVIDSQRRIDDMIVQRIAPRNQGDVKSEYCQPAKRCFNYAGYNVYGERR